MEINNLNNNSMISAYRKVAKAGSAGSKSGTEAVKSENVDKLEFDFSRSIGAAKANLASSIDAEANTSRLEALRQAYAGDSCPVEPEKVAETIVNG